MEKEMSYLEDNCEKLHLEDATDEELIEELIKSRLSEEQCYTIIEFAVDILYKKFNKIIEWWEI